MLTLFNTLTRKKDVFEPIKNNDVGMYTCGQTVYLDAHIGNFRTYTFEDILERTLEMEGYAVKRVMNITDVGHLVGDGDEGEDKLVKTALKEGKTAWEIAEMYTQRFLEDAEKLHLRIPKPPLLCKATDHIKEQIVLIQRLEEKGIIYKISDGMYFDTSKFPDYGKLGGQRAEEKEGGARVALNPEKRNKTDFALWKFSYAGGRDFDASVDDPKTRRHMEWPSPWGLGFPGWHVECSAMAHAYLGQPLDIHCGGVDHIPVHHENEIAQSEAAYGAPFAKWWMHVEFLMVDGQKMSKSLGNFYTIRDIEARGIDPLALRYFYLGAHYRQKQNFTWEALQAAASALNGLRETIQTWDAPEGGVEIYEGDAQAAFEEDLNTPKALAVLHKLVADVDASTANLGASLLKIDQVLGLELHKYLGLSRKIPQEIRDMVQQREEARANKDWSESDRLRDVLDGQGWKIEDTSTGSRVVRKAV